MSAYRKKPVVIQAWPISQLIDMAGGNWHDLPAEVREHYESGNLIFLPNEIRVGTLEGWMTGSFGDWLICGVMGEFYPCKPDVFEATYEKVEPENDKDICGFCGTPGADKFPHPVRWPGEQSAGTELVHAECENAEHGRAHAALSDAQRQDFLRRI